MREVRVARATVIREHQLWFWSNTRRGGKRRFIASHLTLKQLREGFARRAFRMLNG